MRNLTYASLVVVCAALSAASTPSSAAAQSARSRPRRGDVVGVEMSIEGGLTAERGGTLRWILTAYEVIGLTELRPASGARIHLATSLEQTEDAAEVTTDAFGRALIELAVPDDAPDSFHAVLRLVHENGIQRRYELNVAVHTAMQIELYLARAQVRPGDAVRVFGRLSARGRGTALGAQTLRLTLENRRQHPIAAPVEVTTDAAGVFVHTLELPEEAEGSGGFAVEARAGGDEHPVSARVMGQLAPAVSPSALLVAVAPERAMVQPGERQYVDVVVRSPQGRPLAGTTVSLNPQDRDEGTTTTDARGRARLSWRAPNRTSGIQDVAITVTADREGWGRARGSAQVRIAAEPLAFAMAVEGGQLPPSLGGRVFVRVVTADGRPAAAGIEVRASGPRLPSGGVSARTDGSGVATLDITLPRAADATTDRCGGQTATAFDLRVGSAQLDTCIGLDPDAAARVRVASSVVQPGGSIEVEVDRVPGAARLPIELTVLSTDGPRAIASGLIPPGERTTSLVLPEDAGGLVWVRARPLFGRAREVVRGGVVGVLVTTPERVAVNAELTPDGRLSVGTDGAVPTGSSVYVVAAPLDEARALFELLQGDVAGPLGDLRVPFAQASPALIQATIAAAVPVDDAAPAVLRAGHVIASPAPENPTASGQLRDPWRSRARFVTGRLALIVRALEAHVGSSVPERTDDVAVRGPRGFTFNSQILEAVAHGGSLGGAGATGLGGDPLTIEQLQRFDSTLTYNNVARRITRERLFRLILALRAFVAQNGFDLPWSRLGDPSQWMRQLQNRSAPGVGPISRQYLVDGWGRPFELRPSRGGRARFSFVDPLGSWELVSAGPDGRFGNGDDQWDPTARILRSGTPYAEAVGEDILVARLQGVELGRASIELLRGVEPQARVTGVPSQAGAPARQRAQQLWNRLPTVFSPPIDPLALRRPAQPARSQGGVLSALDRSGVTVPMQLGEEPRTWGAVAWARTPGGAGAAALSSTLAGSPLIVEANLPSFLRTGEAVELEVVVTNVTDTARTLRPEATADGGELTAPSAVTIPPGEASSFVMGLSPGGQVGRGHATLALFDEQRALRTVRWDLRRIDGSHPQRLRAAGLVRDRPFRVHWTNPPDARFSGGRIVVLAPSALAADPDLSDLREQDPALVAFSDALAGRRSDPELWARLLRRQGELGVVEGQDPMLSTACAAVAWASADRYDERARAALARVRQIFARRTELGGNELEPDMLASAAALLGALSAGGVPAMSDSSRLAQDPLARLAALMRVSLRRTVRRYPEEPSLLARASAALLLADPRDAYGLAMLEMAEAHLVDTTDAGARVEPSERRRTATESLAGTAALAVAAYQAGREELSTRLLRGALARDHVALRAGGESAFWLLAAGAYGSFGEAANRVTVTVDGSRQEVLLESGRAVLPLDPSGASHEVVVEAGEGAAFVRVEAAAARDFVARSAGPLELSLDGDVGDPITGAGLELTVRAREPLDEPSVVVVQLPAGVEGDAALRQVLSRAAGVVRVERREPAFLRLTLAPMAAGTELTIPLPLRWTVTGTLRGLGVIAFPLGRPEAMTVIAPRRLVVPAAR